MPYDIRCPICGSETVLRTLKKGPDAGNKFHMCLHYPDCKGKVEYDPEAEHHRKVIEKFGPRPGESSKEWNRRIMEESLTRIVQRQDAKQQELIKLTDDELMEVSYKCAVAVSEWFRDMRTTGKGKSTSRDESDLYFAAEAEVDRRVDIACSSQKNGEPPSPECKKWLDYLERKRKAMKI